jgi:tRNA(Ile)-lysidine synthetase-like protein
LLALSGGPDSTALLLAALELGWMVTAAHYDHRLRAESTSEADHVAALCERLAVPLIRGHRAEKPPPGSLQAAARKLRYEFLERAMTQAEAEGILLGHTADDLVEGAVIHLLRGSGLAGLRGMPVRRGPVRRPMLMVWRHHIEAYLAAEGVVPLRDPSNGDTRFLRAWVRHRFLPQLEADRPGLSRRLHGAALQAARLQEQIEAEAARLDGGRRSDLAVAPWAIRAEAYRRMYARAGGPQPGLARRQLEQIDGLVLAGRTGSGLDLPKKVRLRIGAESAWMEQPEQVEEDHLDRTEHSLVIRSCPGCGDPAAVHLDPDRVKPGSLWIGSRRPGLRMRPINGRGMRKLQDILVDGKVARNRRDRLPLIFAGDRLAWVPGLAVEADLAAVIGRPSLHVSLQGGPGTPC